MQTAEQPLMEVVDAEMSSEVTVPRAWLDKERETIRALAEEMVKPIADQLQKKDKELQEASFRLGYLEGRMQDQEAQIKLLPDFQARAAEAEKLKAEAEEMKQKAKELEQSAELKALEVESLKKQIMAVQEERNNAAAEIERVMHEKKTQEKAVQEQLAVLTSKLERLEQPWWKRFFSSEPVEK